MVADPVPGPNVEQETLKNNIALFNSIHYEELGASIKRRFKEVKGTSIAHSRSFALTHRRGKAPSTSSPEKQFSFVPNGAMEPQTSLLTGPAESSTPTTVSRPDPQLLTMEDISVPPLLQQGTPMTKISGNKQKTLVFRLNPDEGQILWESKKQRISAFSGVAVPVPISFRNQTL
jgi:hypothetical protein